MTKANRNALLAGAVIVAAIWIGALAHDTKQKRHRIVTSDEVVVISTEIMSPDESQAALQKIHESDGRNLHLLRNGDCGQRISILLMQ